MRKLDTRLRFLSESSSGIVDVLQLTSDLERQITAFPSTYLNRFHAVDFQDRRFLERSLNSLLDANPDFKDVGNGVRVEISKQDVGSDSPWNSSKVEFEQPMIEGGDFGSRVRAFEIYKGKIDDLMVLVGQCGEVDWKESEESHQRLIIALYCYVENIAEGIRSLGNYKNPALFSHASQKAYDLSDFIVSQSFLVPDVQNLLELLGVIIKLGRVEKVCEALPGLLNLDNKEVPTPILHGDTKTTHRYFSGVVSEGVVMDADLVRKALDDLLVVLTDLKSLFSKLAKYFEEGTESACIDELEYVNCFVVDGSETSPPKAENRAKPDAEKFKTLVDECLLAADFEEFATKQGGLIRSEKFYGPLLNRVFSLDRKGRIDKGMQLLVANGVVSEEESSACLDLSSAKKSVKFREDYLLKLIELAHKVNRTRVSIIQQIGAPGLEVARLVGSRAA